MFKIDAIRLETSQFFGEECFNYRWIALLFSPRGLFKSINCVFINIFNFGRVLVLLIKRVVERENFDVMTLAEVLDYTLSVEFNPAESCRRESMYDNQYFHGESSNCGATTHAKQHEPATHRRSLF